MGFKGMLKQGWEQAKVEQVIAKHGPYRLTAAGITDTREKDTRPIAGVTARLEQGEALQRRITATRIVATGVFALAWRKRKGGEWWLTIEGPEFAWVAEVDRKDQKDARKFAAKVNTQARG